MECTIGWIRKDKGYILFKNRDTKKEFLKDNLFRKTKRLIKIGYASRRAGCWIGINQHGVGFTSAKGPYREIHNKYASWTKFNGIGELILRESETLKEALDKFIEAYKSQKIGESANIILCDSSKAYILELCSGKTNTNQYKNFVFRTNHFESMKRYNKYFRSLKTSEARLKKFKELFFQKRPQSADELIPLLTHHSMHKDESICRHGRIMTVGCAIFEVIDTKVLVNYSINTSPCENQFNKRVLQF